MSNLQDTQYKYHIEKMNKFVCQRRINHWPLSELQREFIRYCANDTDTILWFIQPGYKRIKTWLYEHGYCVGQIGGVSVALLGESRQETYLLYTSDAADEEDSVDLGG